MFIQKIGKLVCLVLVLLAPTVMSAVIDDITAMPDNSWLMLPDEGSKPKVRSSSPVMFYDGDSVGYLWGCSHAKPDNDLWSFNLAANRWRENLPTEPSALADPMVIKIKDSIIMTREERPLSAHQWSGMDFDTDQKRLWWNPHIAWQGLYSGHSDTICKYYPGPACRAYTPFQVFWYYDPPTNKWHYVNSRTNSSIVSCYGCKTVVFRYLPFLKKFILLRYGNSFNGKFLFFDPATQRLEETAGTRVPIPGDTPGSGNYDGTCAGAVYHTGRDILIFMGRAGGTWIFDPRIMKFEQIITEAESVPVWTDCPMSYMVYDSHNQIVLAFVTTDGQGCYDVSNTYAARGWPSTGTHVYTLDIDNKKWDLLPDPAAGDNPNNISGSMGHAYFDRNLGVIFHFSGTYDGMNGQRWIYKYKNAPANLVQDGIVAGKEGIRVWPNPFSGRLTIQFKGQGSMFKVQIFNINGKMVKDFSSIYLPSGRRGIPSTFYLQAAGLSPGIYILKLTAGSKTVSKRIFLIK
jgi:hypothetical protein